VELGRLLQLILGCAVNCEKKQGKWKSIEDFHFLKTIYIATRLLKFTVIAWQKTPWNVNQVGILALLCY
jgi:hypothetical protein